jgi:hypothetical protein
MNALVRKEVQLLGPMWLAALVLAVAPLCLIKNPANLGGWGLFVLSFWLGTLLLGVTSFGREISAATFSQLLAQPISRQRLWRIKTIVLAVAMLSVFAAFYVTLNVRLTGTIKLPTWWWAHPVFESVRVGSNLAMAGVMALTAFAGGLWSTLLLRQFLAAFLITMLTPWMIALPANLLTEKIAGSGSQIILVVGCVVLGLYAVVGFLLARWLFLKAQDVAWTGGVITLPRFLGRHGENQVVAARPARTQITALLRKEFHFQQISLIFAGLLFVLHVAVLFAQKWLELPQASIWNFLFETFWLFWFVLPLLIGCMAVAEERRLGTLEPQLCLPASRLKQFLVKALMVVVFALGLGGAPVWVMDWCGQALGLKSYGATSSPNDFWAVPVVAMCIAMVGLYASSLSRNFLQALAASFGVFTFFALINFWLIQSGTLFGLKLWDGPIGVLLGGVVAWWLSFSLLSWRGRRRLLLATIGGFFLVWTLPLLLPGLRSLQSSAYVFSLAGLLVGGGSALLVLVLAFQNYRQVNTDARLWRRNLGVWLAGLMITSVLATATYHRAWEIGGPFEPPAGPPRLSGNVRPVVEQCDAGRVILVLLPDGQLRSVRRNESADLKVENCGSDWVAIAADLNQAAGVKLDGTLWRLSWWGTVQTNGVVVPEAAHNWKDAFLQRRLIALPVTATRMDRETNWIAIAAGANHFLALKRDGTLWGWGENRNDQLAEGVPDLTITPVQLGTEADWVFVSGFTSGSVAVRRDHSVWKWGRAHPITARGIGKEFIGSTPQKIATLSAGVSRMISTHCGDIVFCEDGTGWGLGQIGNYLGAGDPMLTTLTKLWDNSRWTEASGEMWSHVVGIRSDGSMWLQNAQDLSGLPDPKPLGVRTDWIALHVHYPEGFYALASDGTLHCFGEESTYRAKLTRPTRRVTWSVNLLDAAQP